MKVEILKQTEQQKKERRIEMVVTLDNPVQMIDMEFEFKFDPFEGKSVCDKCENFKTITGLNGIYYHCKIEEPEQVIDYIIGKEYIFKKHVSYKEKNKNGDCEHYSPKDPIEKIEHFFANDAKVHLEDLENSIDDLIQTGKQHLSFALDCNAASMRIRNNTSNINRLNDIFDDKLIKEILKFNSNISLFRGTEIVKKEDFNIGPDTRLQGL